MKKAIALAAATLASITTAPAALAQCTADGWCYESETDATTSYVKIISRNGRYVTADVKTVYKPSVRVVGGDSHVKRRVFDCQAARYRFPDEQTWIDLSPGGGWMSVRRVACR